MSDKKRFLSMSDEELRTALACVTEETKENLAAAEKLPRGGQLDGPLDRSQFDGVTYQKRIAYPKRKRLVPKQDCTVPPADGNPRAFGYARVSTSGQYERDNSIPDQSIRMDLYHQLQLKGRDIQWMGVTDDGRGTSARIRPFMTRAGAMQIVNQLRQGDHLVIDKFDRVFRDVRDFLHCADWFERNDITLHILNLGGSHFQADTPIGKLLLVQFAALAQFEAENTSLRIKESCKAARERGYSWTKAPIGTRLGPRVKGKIRRLLWDHDRRKVMALILHMRDVLYMTWHEITWEVEIFIKGQPPVPQKLKYTWCCDNQTCTIENYFYEYFYRAANVTDPCQIPYKKVVFEYSRDHKAAMTKVIAAHRAQRKLNAQAEKDRVEA